MLALLALATAGPAHAATHPHLDLGEAKRTARTMLQPLVQGLDGHLRLQRCARGNAVTVACRAIVRLPDGSCRLRIQVRERADDYVAHVRSMRCG